MLTDVALRKAKAQDKPYTLRDERGLYVEVRPSGRKFWRLRCWTGGKESLKTLGEYPHLSLAKAREMRDKIKSRDGGDAVSSLEALGREWLDKQVRPVRTPKHIYTLEYRFFGLVCPDLGKMDASEISAVDVLAVLRKIESKGTIETARRTRQILGQIFRYGVATGRCDRDVTQDLRGALQTVKSKSMATITDPAKIGGLIRSIAGLSGQIRYALMLQAYTAVRPGELRLAEWSEIEGDTWKIPAERMKMKRIHWVPLSRQAMKVVEDLRSISWKSKYLFPSVRTKARPMSDVTVNAAIRRMGYGPDEFTGHGFRSMFSTIANENHWPPDVIERQLAHVERNSVRAAYNHAEYLDKRREMMQWWADWLDGVRG